MTLTMTLNNNDISIIDSIKDLISTHFPKLSFSITENQEVEEKSATKTAEEIALEERRKKIEALCGCLSQYANPKLQKKEKDAWAMAMKEKYAVR